MKTNSINKKNKLEYHHINIEVLEKKPNACKNISPTFKYLTFIFQTVTNFKCNSKYVQVIFKNMIITI